jgi:hypothetical protein
MSKKRQKSGKIRGWEVHTIAEFRKDNCPDTYIERAAFKINLAKQKDVSNSIELNESISNWAKETRAEGGYISKFNFGIEKWVAIRF